MSILLWLVETFLPAAVAVWLRSALTPKPTGDQGLAQVRAATEAAKKVQDEGVANDINNLDRGL